MTALKGLFGRKYGMKVESGSSVCNGVEGAGKGLSGTKKNRAASGLLGS